MPVRIELTDLQIMQIRSDYAAGLSQLTIADKQGISTKLVRRHVEDIPSRRAHRRQVVFKCDGCPKLFYDPKRERKYCNNQCRVDAVRREVKYRMTEFLWIASTDSWDNIAERLEFANKKAMVAWLRNHGQDVWAQRITGLDDVDEGQVAA